MMTMMMEKTNSTSLAEILKCRSEWEQLVSYRQSFKMPSYDGTIDNLQWFLTHGAKGNRFRKNYDQAKSIATSIIEDYNAGKIE